jgi:hypothetical protein
MPKPTRRSGRAPLHTLTSEDANPRCSRAAPLTWHLMQSQDQCLAVGDGRRGDLDRPVRIPSRISRDHQKDPRRMDQGTLQMEDPLSTCHGIPMILKSLGRICVRRLHRRDDRREIDVERVLVVLMGFRNDRHGGLPGVTARRRSAVPVETVEEVAHDPQPQPAGAGHLRADERAARGEDPAARRTRPGPVGPGSVRFSVRTTPPRPGCPPSWPAAGSPRPS